MINRWMKLALQLLLRYKYLAFCFFRKLWFVFLTLLTNACLKLKVETLYWYADCGQGQEWCHAAFTFSSEHIQQINQIFLLLTLIMHLSAGHRIKSTKLLKCTLNNGLVVFLKDVHEISTSQHGLYSHWALSRRRLSLLKILWGPEGERWIWGPGTG